MATNARDILTGRPMASTLLTAKEVMERLRIKKSAWYGSERVRGFFGPRAIHVSEGKRVYRESDVDLYLAKQEGRVA
jgi:predicted DNA-binding transcriptional regulator AlpA